MKELIYLDTSLLHSFLAQSQQGLQLNFESTEVQDSESKSLVKGTSEDATHDISGELSSGSVNLGFLQTPSGKATYKYALKKGFTRSTNFTQQEHKQTIS